MEHIVCLVTQISEKLCISQIKAHSTEACSCPAFLIFKKTPTVTEKYTTFKLLLSFRQLVHRREKEEGEYF